MRARQFLPLAVAAALAATAAPAAADTPVCNEAENSHRGGYTVEGGIVDPLRRPSCGAPRCDSATAPGC